MIRKIIAIGGGEISKGETLTIDKRIIELSGKPHPKVLFIPTASSDNEAYCQKFSKYYGEKLGGKVSTLLLYSNPKTISKKEIENKILNTDIIYVGGGNTLKMMKLWRRLGIDKLLEKAWKRGIVLCGISAGAICWFESGHSDSMSFYNSKKWDYVKVRGLGFVKGIMCPHYNSGTNGVPRERKFQEMIKKTGGTGIAIDEGCAVEFTDKSYKIISNKPKLGAYEIRRNEGKVIEGRMRNHT
ncbi:MAG: peptidase E [Candidatus Gracilibacteria bacterium]